MTVNFDEIVSKYTRRPEAPKQPVAPLKSHQFLSFEQPEVAKHNQQIWLHSKAALYPIIDLGFLSMIRPDGFPRFAVFTANQSTCWLKLELSSGTRTSLSLSSNFCPHMSGSAKMAMKPFEAALWRMMKQAWWKICTKEAGACHLTLTSEFTGMLSEKTRTLFKEATTEFDTLFLVAEATNWTLSEHKIVYPPNPDPLLIGLKNGVAFLLDQSNTTTAEDYAVREFSESVPRIGEGPL